MEVILTEDIKKLGKAGEVVKVKDGYGRNFLLPQKKALIANSKNIKELESQKRMIEAKTAKGLKDAQAIAGKLGGLELTVEKEAGEGDRLFGSVTNMDISAALGKKGFRVDRHRIVLESPIKNIGTYEIPIKIHPEVTAILKLWVTRKP
jgi:large subunit ribosomal protein L9